MSDKQKNSIKALFLLVVFSLNTIAGFACSIGIDLGYNRHHHHQDHPHTHKSAHHHDEAQEHHSDNAKLSATLQSVNSTEDCCATVVTKFIQLDKTLAGQQGVLSVPFIILDFFGPSVPAIPPSVAVSNFFSLVRRSCPLYDTDIRIAIQSFQI